LHASGRKGIAFRASPHPLLKGRRKRMQNQSCRLLNRASLMATATALVVSFATFAVAQRQDVSAIFAAAPKEPTNVGEVSIFAGPPKGFNALTATNAQLATYGLPQRPDQQINPKAYQHWERGILAAKTRASNLEAQPFSSREMMAGKQTAEATGAGPAQYTSKNWSGAAAFNTLTKWSDSTSYTEVESVFNVPVSQPPLDACASGITGPFYTALWNGIDGFANGDVVQGGSLDYASCKGKANGAVAYSGWVEWYPSYSILTIDCGKKACPVGPGDDFWVITYGVAGTATQTVFVEDLTQQWYGTFSLPYVSGPGLVGNSAEWIVERPCCNGNDNYALDNYIYDFWDYSFAYDGKGTEFYPGSTSAKSAIITMLDDGGTIDISRPVYYGTTGNQGRYSLWFGDENCAYSGGCAP